MTTVISSAAGAPCVKACTARWISSTISAAGRSRSRATRLARRSSPKSLIVGIHRFRHAVAEQDQDIARIQGDARFLVVRHRKDSQNHAAGAFQQFRIRLWPAPPAADCGRHWCRPRAPVFGIGDAGEESDEAIVGTVAASALVEPRPIFWARSSRFLEKHLDAGLQAGHQQRCGHAFPGHIAHHAWPTRPSGNLMKS